MCNLLLTGERFYEISGGIVYGRPVSGDHRDTVCWPLADARTMLGQLQRAIEGFDASHGVFLLRE